MAQQQGLSEGEVRVVCTNLNRTPQDLTALYHHLSPGERERAARFRLEKHRSRFVAARGTLRELIGKYLGCGPESVEFNYGANGKPHLVEASLEFNASHSEDYALYAFTLTVPLGVDIEQVRAIASLEAIAQSFFSPAERAELLRISAAGRLEAFFNCWTRKEAFVKAVGDGLSYPLDRFDVSLSEPARLLTIDGSTSSASEWSLFTVAPARGYVGAVAIRGSGFRLVVS